MNTLKTLCFAENFTVYFSVNLEILHYHYQNAHSKLTFS